MSTLGGCSFSMSNYMLRLTLDALKSFFTGYGEVTNKSLMRH